MPELIAVVSDAAGRRYELSLRMEDGLDAVLDQGEARERLTLLLNREAERAATILHVAAKDAEEARQQAARKAPPKKGSTQIAFAGTNESVELDANGNEVARMKGGKRTVTKAARKGQR